MTKTAASSLSPEHLDFYERFRSFWAAPTGARVAEIIRPDAQIHFTGAGTFSGADYIGFMQGMLDSNPDMNVRAIDCAGDGERLYIFWETRNVIQGKPVTFIGVDRFRLQQGMAIEEHVIFDSAALQPTG
jgi:predicted SnoaL-like aldol condensation-catalyzing enzyme